MSQDPLRTPSEATEDDDLLRDLRASMQAEDSKAFGFTPNGLPAMNAGPTFGWGWGNNAVPPSNQPEGVSMPPGADPTNTAGAQSTFQSILHLSLYGMWYENQVAGSGLEGKPH